ncbi:MAG: hypothetical protein H6Q67_38 [Firmicutes bacterium]|nr:hypothetical protein [Bacillota bacterium]
MISYFADFHIHVGITEAGQWVKIPTSRQLTLRSILVEAAERKGLGIIGVVDALSPLVRADVALLLDQGVLTLDCQGGYRYGNKLTLLLGAEIETAEPGGGCAHTLVFLPDMAQMERFAASLAPHIRNLNLSTQNAHMSLARLVQHVAGFDAILVPAHVFTPYKSVYGACSDRLRYVLNDRELAAISAIELGLSADTEMADRIDELAVFPFLSNSDAHSPAKIAREYNVLALKAPTFEECKLALSRKEGRAITGNFGLDPRLGKYHRTACSHCGMILKDFQGRACPACGSTKIVMGVLDRIEVISDYEVPRHPDFRPVYRHQIPLSFIPGVGKATLDKLLSCFHTEMEVLHQARPESICSLVGEKLAAAIEAARTGNVLISSGGGGAYGKMTKE